MSDWTGGYMADVAYTFGYFSELNPLQTQLAFLNAGLAAPKMGVACELGFGQGLAANIHAAAARTAWWGTDFSPAQTAFAQQLAEAAGTGAHLFDQSFEQFCRRTDLPDFDCISMHGIWSWVSEENRRIIVDFIARKLKVGGVLYVSYNAMPGLAAMAPIRHLLSEHAAVMSAPGQKVADQIDAALEFTEKMLATDPAYARANPSLAERINKLRRQPRTYLAHEYFSRDWQPMSFSEMTQRLAPAKLSYACSADYIDHVPAAKLNAAQQQFLNEIADPTFRETVRSYIVNEQFRRDYWVKGARALSALEQVENLRRQKIILITPAADVSLHGRGNLAAQALPEETYPLIIDALADHQPTTLAQLESALMRFGIDFNQVRQAICILISHGHALAVQDDAAIAAARAGTGKLNRCLIEQARGSGDIAYLASPLTGGGVIVNRIHQLFLLAIAEGHQTPDEWVSFVWRILHIERQALAETGKTPSAAEMNMANLSSRAQDFAERRWPILTALGIAA